MEDLLHSAVSSGFGGRPEALMALYSDGQAAAEAVEATLEKEDLLNNFVSSESSSTAKTKLIKLSNIIIDAKFGVTRAGWGAKEANLYTKIGLNGGRRRWILARPAQLPFLLISFASMCVCVGLRSDGFITPGREAEETPDVGLNDVVVLNMFISTFCKLM